MLAPRHTSIGISILSLRPNRQPIPGTAEVKCRAVELLDKFHTSTSYVRQPPPAQTVDATLASSPRAGVSNAKVPVPVIEGRRPQDPAM
jgi:hypothetical protein